MVLSQQTSEWGGTLHSTRGMVLLTDGDIFDNALEFNHQIPLIQTKIRERVKRRANVLSKEYMEEKNRSHVSALNAAPPYLQRVPFELLDFALVG